MYYKGNNIGLNYDAATGTWVFNNEPQDFVDTNAFSTPDPEFEMAPVVDDDEDDEDEQCSEGYVYDNTLKQCVPDPSVQNRYMDTTSGSDKEERDYAVDPDNPLGIWVPPVQNIDGTWEAGYTQQMPNTMSKFTQEDLVDWGKSKGYITRDGTIVGAMQASDTLGMYKGIGQFLNDRQYNSWLKRVQDKGMAKTVTGPSGTQGVKLTVSVQPDGTKASVQQFDNVMQKKLDAFKSTALLTSTNYSNSLKESGVGDIIGGQEAIRFGLISEAQEKEKLKKAKYDTQIKAIEARRKADQLLRETEQTQKDKKQEKQERQDKTTQDAEERQRRNDQVQKDKDSGYSGSEQDTGGSGSGSSGSGSSYGSGSSEEYDKFEDKQGKPSGGYQRG
jgi:uncharacterized membrane protein YgcG